MCDNYSYLVIPFGDFETRIKAAISAGTELKQVPNSKEGIQEFKQSVNKWIKATQDNLQSSFADEVNLFTHWFITTSNQHQGKNEVYLEDFMVLKDMLTIKCYTLDVILRSINACDFIKDKENTQLKKGLGVVEKAEILLDRLYHLDSEQKYLARMLLLGNGVELKKDSEAIEIAKYLSNKGLIEVGNYAGSCDLYVTISTDGKVLYEERSQKVKQTSITKEPKQITDMTAIFIVHGHNTAMKETVARVVSKIGFDEIILHEQASKGMTIIEKFEAHSNRAQFAIVLLSADDFAYPKNSVASSAKLRPRQNVVFELGYFLGKLGRERVFCLYETFDDFELNSDFDGVVLTQFDERGAWKTDLGKELQALGVQVDWNRLMK